jgi:hypothetical protein
MEGGASRRDRRGRGRGDDLRRRVFPDLEGAGFERSRAKTFSRSSSTSCRRIRVGRTSSSASVAHINRGTNVYAGARLRSNGRTLVDALVGIFERQSAVPRAD